MSYELHGVTGEGEHVQSKKTYPFAPTDNQIGTWAERKKCAFVVRYFPTKKAWRVYDTRVMARVNVGHNRVVFKILRGHFYPTLDAALMTTLHRYSWPQSISATFMTPPPPTRRKHTP